jgi:hypothetical protein
MTEEVKTNNSEAAVPASVFNCDSNSLKRKAVVNNKKKGV